MVRLLRAKKVKRLGLGSRLSKLAGYEVRVETLL